MSLSIGEIEEQEAFVAATAVVVVVVVGSGGGHITVEVEMRGLRSLSRGCLSLTTHCLCWVLSDR
jgi:hypothetical protein